MHDLNIHGLSITITVPTHIFFQMIILTLFCN